MIDPRGIVVVSAASKTAPCLHRGDEPSTLDCPTCAGRVRVKVFACAIHGECTLAKPLPEIACCQGCRDYSPGKAAGAG